ncbi:MAG: hypothetical protein J6L99_02385 [Ruminococcus sp.]|nr:hypothetical protein [Ruminococcus sp.]
MIRKPAAWSISVMQPVIFICMFSSQVLTVKTYKTALHSLCIVTKLKVLARVFCGWNV